MATSSVDLAGPRGPGVAPCRTRPLARRRVGRARTVARRRRLTAILLAGGVMLGTTLMGGSAPASRPGAPGSIVIHRGDTLWSIAERYAPDGVDPRAYIDAVASLNNIDYTLTVGERVRLPR